MDTLTREEVEEIIKRSLRLSVEEKNGMYHGIMRILKDSNNQANAAIKLVMEIEQIFKEKALCAEESMENKEEGKITGQISPIFRRVG